MQTVLKRQKENEQVRHLRLRSSLDIPAVSLIRAEGGRGARDAKAGGRKPRLRPHRRDRASGAGGSDAQVFCERGGADVSSVTELSTTPESRTTVTAAARAGSSNWPTAPPHPLNCVILRAC